MTPPSVVDTFVETGEMALQWKSPVALAKDPTWVPNSIPDSSPRGSLAFFWPPQAPGTYVVHACTCSKTLIQRDQQTLTFLDEPAPPWRTVDSRVVSSGAAPPWRTVDCRLISYGVESRLRSPRAQSCDGTQFSVEWLWGVANSLSVYLEDAE